jgi:3-phosphoshikimate 1-carboxyvinyltransferase
VTRVTVAPGPLEGTVMAPPSKSYTHRALVAGYLSEATYRVRSPLVADDTRATRSGLVALGARVGASDSVWTLRPGAAGSSGPARVARTPTVRCRESGTTLRFLVAVAAREAHATRFVGTEGLARRPMRDLFDTLRAAGARIDTDAPEAALPCRVTGPIRPASLSLDGGVSSQFLSALLLVLPTLEGDSSVAILGDRVSRPYVEATEAVLCAHGIAIEADGRVYEIPGRQRYRATEFRVPGDASSAAYLWAGAAISGGTVTVRGVPAAWPQADRAILDILERMGAQVRVRGDDVTVAAKDLRGTEADLEDSPDLYPLVGVLACYAGRGRTRIRGAAHAAFKESDRRAATVRLVRAFGGEASLGSDGLEIRPPPKGPRGVRLSGIADHRVAMSAAVGALGVHGRSHIDDATCVAKSFPSFWRVLRRLGASVEGTA